MSGGVDSSLAAALVQAEGCETIGITLQLAGSASRCCSLADADDARRVAEKLGHPLLRHGLRRTLRARGEAAVRRRLPGGPHADPLRDLQFEVQVRVPARPRARARRAGGRLGPLRAHRRGSRDAAPAAAARGRPRQGSELLPVRAAPGAARRRALSARRAEQGGGARAGARGSASPPPRSPRARRSASSPTATPRAAVERLRPQALPGAGEIVDAEGRVRRPARGHPSLHGGPAPRPRRGGEGATLRDRPRRARATAFGSGRWRRCGARGARLERVNWIAGAPPRGAGARARARAPPPRRRRGAG